MTPGVRGQRTRHGHLRGHLPHRAADAAVARGAASRPAAAIGVWNSGLAEEADAVLRPLRQFGPPAADLIAAMPYRVLRSTPHINGG